MSSAATGDLVGVIEQLVCRWEARAAELRTLHALVNAESMCKEVLESLRSVLETLSSEVVNLTEGARRSGYSRETLSRLVSAGTIPNAGRRHAPKIRLRDLPRKAGHLPRRQVTEEIPATSKRQIVRSIANLKKESSR